MLNLNARFIVSVILFCIGMQGCATIMHGSTQQITVTSFPPVAIVLVDGGMHFKTPAVLELARKDAHTVEISLEGYQTELVDIRPTSNDAVMGNIIAGGLIGLMVDNSSGGAYRLVPEVIQMSLRPTPAEAPRAQTVTDVKEKP
jgi:hypothetical protein